MGIEGKRVVLTRARGENSTLRRILEGAGAEAVEVPTIEIRAPESWTEADAVMAGADRYDWVVFTSAHGVKAVHDRYPDRRLPRVAVVGPQTARRARSVGLDVALVPSDYRVEGLLAELPEDLGDLRFLLLRGNLADSVLPDELCARGAGVDAVVVYRTSVPEDGRNALRGELEANRVDCVTFTSGSTARHLATMLDGFDPQACLSSVAIAVIGPVTRKAVESLGWAVTIEPKEATLEALGQAVIEYFERSG